MNYDFNASHSSYSNQKSQTYYYLGLTSGFNIGAWRYRNRGTLTRYSGNGTHWQTLGNSLERDIPVLRSRLQLGDNYTSNDVFDSYRFRGVQLSSDQSQLPFSMQMFAPVIRGTANSNARVEIKQNGYTIYSINVAPGPFVIRDISPSTQSGDLLIRVIEADGSVHSFTQAFSAVPSMLRDGIWRYQVTAGKYRNGGYQDNYHPTFIQATAGRGMSNGVTPSSGILLAEHYQAANIGFGKGLGDFGAFSLDLTVASTHIANGDKETGASLRFLYSKSLNSLGTNFQLIGHRYSTAHYYDFSDAVSERAQWQNGVYRYDYDDTYTADYLGVPDWTNIRKRSTYSSQYYNKRSQLQLAITQTLWNNDQIYTNISTQSYWNNGHSQRSWQIGYNGRASAFNYGVYYQYSSGRFTSSERIVGLNFSVPLGGAGSSTYANSYASHSSQNGNSIQTGISGTALSDNRFNYSVQAGHQGDSGNSGSLSAGYQGAAGNVDVGYSGGNHYQQTSVGLNGAVIAHSDGITLGQPLQTTTVLVEAKGADGIRIQNQQGARISRNGYALVSGPSPYRRSQVSLNSADIGSNVDIAQTTKTVIPTRGAIIRVHFDTRIGRSVLVKGKLSDNSDLPLGGTVYDTDGESLGMVGTDGQAFITGIREAQHLIVKWGNDPSQQCAMVIKGLPESSKATLGYDNLSLDCSPISTGKP